ncbi:MAG TPA: helix-turn-helix domain-containing protein, partial [Trebonia sp.]|nr:helix-turn-helix domain-containing protein [Trebonia sp.]
MSQPVDWGPPPAERADAARNRRLLLATAREMLAAHGADKLTMDGLAERAGLGKGTVFRRFGTRPGSSRRCSTTTSGPSSSRCCPVPR